MNWRFVGRLLLAAILLVAALGATFHNAVLNATAGFLVAPDAPEKADLIYVLGGNYLVRAPAAAELFRRGFSSKILLAREPTGIQDGRLKDNFTDVTRGILVKNGVPDRNIVEFTPKNGVGSTADEARALRIYLDVYPASTVLVVTSSFHTRRARMALTRAVRSNTRVLVAAVNDPDCTPANWQSTNHCRSQVKVEWLKLVYYLFTFFG